MTETRPPRPVRAPGTGGTAEPGGRARRTRRQRVPLRPGPLLLRPGDAVLAVGVLLVTLTMSTIVERPGGWARPPLSGLHEHREEIT
ncbi:hypothetical protein [Actinomadura macra]|uniref:hypothetical protein n=1 Tax=Actinomadura macra TaxID=46164 RepID=UPI0012F98678|nr:hypothetical protein [Actinomadura macra]